MAWHPLRSDVAVYVRNGVLPDTNGPTDTFSIAPTNGNKKERHYVLTRRDDTNVDRGDRHPDPSYQCGVDLGEKGKRWFTLNCSGLTH